MEMAVGPDLLQVNLANMDLILILLAAEFDDEEFLTALVEGQLELDVELLGLKPMNDRQQFLLLLTQHFKNIFQNGAARAKSIFTK